MEEIILENRDEEHRREFGSSVSTYGVSRGTSRTVSVQRIVSQTEVFHRFDFRKRLLFRETYDTVTRAREHRRELRSLVLAAGL